MRLSIVLGICVAAAAQPLPWKPEELCTLEGRAVDARTGQPLRKVQVTVRPEVQTTPLENEALVGATTGNDGSFAITGVAPGRYRVLGERSGYVSQALGARSPGGSAPALVLNPGDRVKDLALRLTPQGTISGRVYDEDGEPLRNARITALRSGYAQGRRLLSPTSAVSTNDLGEYRLFDLEPGRYFVSAAYRAHSASLTQGGDEYAPTYYGGAADPNRAVPLEVGPGSQINSTDFHLVKTRAVEIRGRVGASAVPAGGRVTIELTLRGAVAVALPARNSASSLDENGQFRILGVTPGSYVLTASYGTGDQRYSASTFVEVSQNDVSGINLIIGPGAAMSGRARVLGDRPTDFRKLSVNLEPVESSGFTSRVAQMNADGSFLLTGIPDGDYSLSIAGAVPAGVYTRSIRHGSAEIFGAVVRIANGQGLDGLDVVLDPSGATIEGVVLDDDQKPLAGATVALVPNQGRDKTYFYRPAVSAQDGHFVLTAVRPGDYKLFAWAEIEYDAYYDPDFLKPYDSQGQAVSVKPNGRDSVQVRVLPANPVP